MVRTAVAARCVCCSAPFRRFFRPLLCFFLPAGEGRARAQPLMPRHGGRRRPRQYAQKAERMVRATPCRRPQGAPVVYATPEGF